jgi:hypothetical protein
VNYAMGEVGGNSPGALGSEPFLHVAGVNAGHVFSGEQTGGVVEVWRVHGDEVTIQLILDLLLHRVHYISINKAACRSVIDKTYEQSCRDACKGLAANSCRNARLPLLEAWEWRSRYIERRRSVA